MDRLSRLRPAALPWLIALLCIPLLVGCQDGSGPSLATSPEVKPAPEGKKPNPSPADPAIVFATYGGGRGRIKVMNSDGSNIATVLEYPRFSMAFNPSWSRDASAIAFFDWINGISLLDVDVVGGVPTGTNARLLLDRGAYPAWSPVSDEIAFVDVDLGTLEIIPATGGDPTVVYTITLPGAVYPTWSPDGTRIAFTEGGAIRVLDLASNEVTTVLGPEWGQQFGMGPGHLDWARTQDVLTFGVGTDASGDLAIYTLELPSGTPTFVVEGKWPTWSPDDQKICFSDGDIIDLTTLEVTDIRAGAQWPDWRRF